MSLVLIFVSRPHENLKNIPQFWFKSPYALQMVAKSTSWWAKSHDLLWVLTILLVMYFVHPQYVGCASLGGAGGGTPELGAHRLLGV